MSLSCSAKFLVYTTILSALNSPISSHEQYCWRDFSGVIPRDAFVAAQDKNGDNIYVGQAYHKNSGIIPVEIHKGIKEVHVPIGGNKPPVTTKGIKILCGHNDDFIWIATSNTRLKSDLINKIAVIGGFEDAYGNYNVGRVSYGGDTRIGKVNSFWDGNAEMFFANGDVESKVTIYQVLVIENATLDIDVRAITF